MNTKSMILASVFVGLSASFVLASGHMSSKCSGCSMAAHKNKTVVSSQAIEVGNKTCPVSGNPIGTMGEVVKQEYKGKVYSLCCGMCVKDFTANPEKYSKIADAEVALVK